jgi:hypothetical protein
MLDAPDGFDLDNADGDNDPYTGADNALGDALLTDGLNGSLITGIEDGSIGLLLSLTGIDSFTDDPDVQMSFHQLVDPACPTYPVYDAYALPPWVDAAPADVYSDSSQFIGCAAPAVFDDSVDPNNGIYNAGTVAVPTAPTIQMAGTSVTIGSSLGDLTMVRPRFEATVGNDGSYINSLTNGLLGGVLPADVLYRTGPVAGTNCSTALHAVLALIGQPDQEGLSGGGLDTFAFRNTGAFGLSCLFIGDTVIDDCTDGDTGANIANTSVDGDCVLDVRMDDGYSAALAVEAQEVHVVEQRDSTLYCP